MTLKSYVCLRKVVDPLMMKYDDTEIEWIIDELEALVEARNCPVLSGDVE